MSESGFHLVFRGEVLDGQERSAVARRLAALLKLDAARIRALFSGKPVVLKRDVPKAVAARYQAAFREAGARLRVLPAAEAAADSAAKAPAARPTLAERLAAAEEAVERRAAARSSQPGLPQTGGEAGLGISAPGADLIDETEVRRPPPVTVDVSHLSAAEANSGSFEDVLPPPPPPPPAPDTSTLELDAPGVDLAPPSEVPELELDLSALSVAEPGADLGSDDGPPPVAVPDPDFALAPPGADLETLAEPPPPPPPDVSHLRVE